VFFLEQEGVLKPLQDSEKTTVYIPFCGLLSVETDYRVFLYIDHNNENVISLDRYRSIGFWCPFCGLIVTEKRDLDRHLPVHRGPVSCDHCDSEFEDKLELLEHRKSCIVKCDVLGCNKSFPYKRKLEMPGHKRKHRKSV
jgi:hypothetical protein